MVHQILSGIRDASGAACGCPPRVHTSQQFLMRTDAAARKEPLCLCGQMRQPASLR